MASRIHPIFPRSPRLLLELRRKLPPIPGHSIPFLSRRILLDPLSGKSGAPHRLVPPGPGKRQGDSLCRMDPDTRTQYVPYGGSGGDDALRLGEAATAV